MATEKQQHIWELAVGKLNKSLDEKEEAEFDKIQHTTEGRKALEEAQNIYSKSGKAFALESIDKKRGWAKISNEMNKYPANRKLFISLFKYAAVLFVGILLTTAVFYRFDPLWQTSADYREVVTPNGARTNFELPDGSIVWLNSGSSVKYATSFRKTREVELHGEAFFDVAKTKNTFIVSTGFGDVEVKGTAFNVKAYENESFQTTLVRGAVIVRPENRKAYLLKPGQQAVINKQEMKIHEVNTEMVTSWKDGKIIFRKEYLPQMAERLERWYNVKIELADDERLNEIWYSGTLEMESFSEVLELLKITAQIDYTYNEKTRTIKIFYR
jgi:ferric-dicitrate binding protein FerR (iron transport regulator)